MSKKMEQEVGGHRFQRVPPTERRGRVHTSSVIVFLEKEYSGKASFSDKDISVSWFSGTGSGGQHRNKHQNCCRITHFSSKITVTGQGHRSRSANERDARNSLQQRLDDIRLSKEDAKSSEMRSRAGSGQRGDKIRTVRFQDDIAKDHRTGSKTTASSYMSGRIDDLWIGE